MSSFHVMAGGTPALVQSDIRRITTDDLRDALRAGWRDFVAMPMHLAFLVLLYPLVGVCLGLWTAGNGTIPMLFPLMAGFALLGPLAGIGLYEISRRRELGQPVTWRTAFDVRHSLALPSIIAVGAFLLALFIAWNLAARGLYAWLFGEAMPDSASVFMDRLFNSPEGWNLIVLGNLIGALFALVVLATASFSFPMLLDRDCGAVAAMQTSVRAFLGNPAAMIMWGVIVAVLLALGSLPLFAGLAIVLPVLGHATWHLYRKVVAR